MNKSLIIILHYNTAFYTDNLYESLKPYERNDYEIFVLDNGSDEGKSSKYTTWKSEKWGGYGTGLDLALQLFIENKEYDSFVLLNSDLVLHGYNFIKTLRQQLFSRKDLMIVSPCVIQPEKAQSYWKQMHCFNSTTLREVPFVDYQCAFMKRKFAEKVKSFESTYGWIQDMMTGLICEDNKWKIAVCDWAPVIHIGNATVKANAHLSNYNILAQQEMEQYFISKGLMDRVNQLKLKSINYKYEN